MILRDRRKDLGIVLGAAALFRFAFLLWGWSGIGVMPHSGMSEPDFMAGYAIAAGYGYVEGHGKAYDHLRGLYDKASAGFIVTPESAGALPSEGVRPWMLHPPGFSLLVAGLHRLFGAGTEDAVALTGLVLDVAAAGLIWWMAGTLMGPRVGLFAGLVYAFYPPYAYWSTVSKSTDGILAPFIVATLACMVWAIRSEGRVRLAGCAVAGAILGITGYFRPDYMLLPVFLGIVLAIHTRQIRRSILAAGLMQAVVVLLLLPWAYRNFSVCGRWVFTSTSVGATLINSLGEVANPWGYGPLDEDRDKEAQALGMVDAWGPDADAYFRGLFWRSVRQRPFAVAILLVRRIPMALATPYTFGLQNPLKTRTFSEAQAGGETYLDVATRRPLYVLGAYWDRILMGMVSLFGAVCCGIMLFHERHRIGPALLLLSPHLYSLGAHYVTFLWPRYVLPTVFCWLIAMGYVLARGWRRGDPGDRPRRAGLGGPVRSALEAPH